MSIVCGSWDNKVRLASAIDGATFWEKKFESEIVDVLFGNDKTSSLIVVTQEGEVHCIPHYLLGGVKSTFEFRVEDVKFAFCCGLHTRLGKDSPVYCLHSDVVRIVFDFLFHKYELSRNVVLNTVFASSFMQDCK
jgi:hypothetical protein